MDSLYLMPLFLLTVLVAQAWASEDETMQRGMDRCMEKMKKNPMMTRMFTSENMLGICRNQMTWAIKVDRMRNSKGPSTSNMSPGSRQFLSSLGGGQSQVRVSQGQGQDNPSWTLKSEMMQAEKANCMNKMEKTDMIMKMFTEEQRNGICTNEMTWVMKAEEARRRDPSMRSKVDSMSQPVRDYFNSLERDTRQKRSTNSPRPRKEYRMLTAKERQAFHDAINAMKNTMVDDDHNEYDVFVDYHQTDVSPGAHWGASFLGWHREYLVRMERALQRHNPTVMLPYWDSTLDNNLGDLANRSIMWSEDFMGNVEGPVTTGPFANWETPRATYGRAGLWRGGGTWSNGSLYSDELVDAVIGIDDFRNMTYQVNPFVESAHGLPHLWVGGPMGHIENSPIEPIFFMHHPFVDLLWETQQQRIFREGRRSEYFYPRADDHEAYGVGENQITPNIVIDDPRDSFHFITNTMNPFEHLINADGLRDSFRLLYTYDPRPTCSRKSPTCGSPYLFCIDEVYKCAPKLQLGASCKGLESSDSCYEGICDNGVCSRIPKCD